ncbi:MAG: hypothetical protein GY869_13575, partial [Planctomycetes bacterium]|nr:hypothetical protein [Planctomycetota bacterium]
MNKESKDLLKSVIPATIVALGICIILGMIMSKDTDYHPKSHWNLELAKSATNVKIIPRFDLNKYNLTVNREIIFTHTDEIIDWANAIEEARRGNNPSPHRSRG